MVREFDVVVVGGRCAGSPLAALLARGGLSVGDATCKLAPDQVRDIITALLGRNESTA